MKKKRIYKSKLDEYDIKRTLVSSIILVVFTVGAIILVFNALDTDSETTVMDDLWQKAYEEVKGKRVGIQFEPLTTKLSDYGSLRSICNNYIEELDRSNQIDKSLGVDISISETEFADVQNSNNTVDIRKKGYVIPDLYYWTKYSYKKSTSTEYTMVETGPIYFNNLMMLKYINNSGDLVVIYGGFGDNGEPVVIKQNEIVDFLDTKKNGIKPLTISNNTTDAESESISESEYADIIIKCIESILQYKINNDMKEMSHDIAMYFNNEGRESVTELANTLNLDTSARIETKICLLGKSYTSNNNKDRVYIQLDIHNNEETKQEFIVIKLDNNLKVFDIDVL